MSRVVLIDDVGDLDAGRAALAGHPAVANAPADALGRAPAAALARPVSR